MIFSPCAIITYTWTSFGNLCLCTCLSICVLAKTCLLYHFWIHGRRLYLFGRNVNHNVTMCRFWLPLVKVILVQTLSENTLKSYNTQS
jgi:hypothetical protein